MKGKFIVFEAIDGSGTTTQAKLLYEYLHNRGDKVKLTKEPSFGAIGYVIEDFLRGQYMMSDNKKTNDKQLALLFTADRYDHLYNKFDGIIHRLNAGCNIICTRYIMSSMVYNCHGEEEEKFVRELNKDFPSADLTFFIDCPINICLERLSKREVKDMYENKTKLTKVKEKYLNLLKDFSPLFIIDGNKTIKDQHNDIINIMKLKKFI